MTYDTLRHFADSWGLLALVMIFVGIVAFAMRPGAGKVYARIARLPLDDDKEI
ncbi:cbb3-type cytochrome c oxidase subunit 3 [Taklimakanibacter lacteus]|uniref:cbb3-type cytochrome c oxidase subunit 3 n=1 Tax=Taklimakanibacter lacteus TaxID=2268456 RepID=UPI000E660C5E